MSQKPHIKVKTDSRVGLLISTRVHTNPDLYIHRHTHTDLPFLYIHKNLKVDV